MATRGTFFTFINFSGGWSAKYAPIEGTIAAYTPEYEVLRTRKNSPFLDLRDKDVAE